MHGGNRLWQVTVLCRSRRFPPSSPGRAKVIGMARPKTDDDATKNLRPGDATQTAPKGTKIGLLRKADVLGDFRKLAKHDK